MQFLKTIDNKGIFSELHSVLKMLHFHVGNQLKGINTGKLLVDEIEIIEKNEFFKLVKNASFVKNRKQMVRK